MGLIFKFAKTSHFGKIIFQKIMTHFYFTCFTILPFFQTCVHNYVFIKTKDWKNMFSFLIKTF